MPYSDTEKSNPVWKGQPPLCERCKQTATREFLWDDGAVCLYVTVCESCHAKIEEEIRKDTLMCENCGIRPATQEHVERNGIHEVLGKPPGWKDDDGWLTWGVCEECHEDEERVKFHAQQHNRDMIIIEVDEDGGAAQVLFSEEFHQSSSTFKADVIQDIILALQPLYEQYVHETHNR
jgi:hypothetical protein